MITPVKKFSSLQIVRALAAWTVVFHHYMQLYFGLESTSPIGAFFADYGSLGVDVFFVLSGFVMYLVATKEQTGASSFLINRLFRIAPVYWFYSGLVVASIYLFPSGFSYTDFNLNTLLMSATFLPHSNPSGLGVFPILTVGWTLNFEMFFYLALACCMAMSSRHFLKILALVFLILPLVYPKSVPYSYIASSFKLYEFLAGALLAVVWTGAMGEFIRRYQKMSLAAAGIGVVAGIAILLMLREARLPVAFAIVAFALLCERYLRTESLVVRALVRLGDESYSTYLSHCIVIGIAVHLTGKHLGPEAHLTALATIIIGILVMSSLSYRLLESNKYLDGLRIRLIRRLGARPQSDAKSRSAVP